MNRHTCLGTVSEPLTVPKKAPQAPESQLLVFLTNVGRLWHSRRLTDNKSPQNSFSSLEMLCYSTLLNLQWGMVP